MCVRVCVCVTGGQLSNVNFQKMKGQRADARSDSQMRPSHLEQGLLGNADGSCRFSMGGTRVTAAVFGPAEALQRDELIERAALEVVYKDGDEECISLIRGCVEAVCLSR